MSSKHRGCPKCRGVMEFRLGEFVCTSCGQSQPATPPKEEKKSSGPGFRSEKKWDGAIAEPEIPGADPQAPDKGTVFSITTEHEFSKDESARQKPHSFLHIEKHVFFGLSFLMGAVRAFGGGFQQNPADAFLGNTWSIICIAVWLVFLAFALYGSEILVKQTCMGLAGLQLVGTLASVFYTSTWVGQFTAPGLAGGASFTGVLILVFAVFGVAWQVWLIWILYRDSQYLQ